MFHPCNESTKTGLAFKPQNVNTTPIQGEAIVEPWKKGRSISFSLIAGAFAAADSIVVTPKRRRVGTTTWDTIADKDGNTLVFDTYADGGLLENSQVVGSIDFDRINVDSADSGESYDYDAIALFAVNGNAANVIVGASYTIFDLYSNRSADNDRDTLRAKGHPSNASLGMT